MPYVAQKFDCADLAVRVRREVFGQEIELPTDHGSGRAERDDTIRRNLPAYAERTETPRDGDGVLLRVRGLEQHIGVYCAIGTHAWVLHNHSRAGVHLVRVRDLARFGYLIVGFYRWI